MAIFNRVFQLFIPDLPHQGQPRGTTKRSAGRTSTFAEQPAPAGEKQFDPLLDPWQLGTASVARNINGYKWL